MSFKFKLGEIVVPVSQPERSDLPEDPSEVVAIQLGGYMQIKSLDTNHRLVVRSIDYQKFDPSNSTFS